MLIPQREKGESIRIGDDIEIVVLEVRRGPGGPRVRLGINAPKHVSVHRQEVYEAIQAEERRKAIKELEEITRRAF